MLLILLKYSREKMIRGVRRGCVRLKGAIIGIDDEDNTTFTVTVDGKTFHFQARNFDERERWVRCLEDTIVRHAYGCLSSTSSMQFDSSKTLPTLHNFDKKVAEADAYLQLLINQVKDLEIKIVQMESDERDTCERIIRDTNAMLEQVKHTIVLLQIAKNSAFPVNGTYQPPVQISNVFVDECRRNSKEDIEVGTEINEKDMLPAYRKLPANSGYRADIPEVSYSTSEDEDFYDAREDDCLADNDRNNSGSEESSPTYRRHMIADCSPTLTPKRSPSVSTNDDTAASGNEDGSRRESVITRENINNSSEVPLLPDGSIDFDALYEDPSENELLVELQGSVVKHLISQVKIGMDLTKVVLPTFVLERRSLLEMYADCLAHSDEFLKAADLETPRDRMVQIVKWYLSSFHAGRKSSVAKKPYNPILGEIFQCWWNLETVPDNNNDTVNNDGPVPWCKNNQLVFIAEQVSHHPPISAFYAEHPNKKVSLCAHVWTKSKFLGLSIGVHNIGNCTVKLLEKQEEYVFTFPNGYVRSILTVPWIELGGATSIKCPQTGYYCNIEFLTKPFYGGKKHRISAEVFGPKDKKPFLTVAGEWNGLMEAKWSEGHSEPFVDTKKMPIIKKQVRKIEEQEDNESRKMWKLVTLGLKYNDVDQATNAKIRIEQKQRDEAQNRKEKNESWEPKYFYEEDGAWYYRNPLEKRINVQLTRPQSSIS
ncbi:oxysterol-binding protein-related protein 9 isoform X2 [Planococcus citri]|uniref:oxysterol-binding protein-related protein 9 isoform X2 n=1 Tax=Planococcus citri TaxID=170843 RepID=UPI0031FA3100